MLPSNPPTNNSLPGSSLVPPQSWSRVGRVSSLYVYPVKSCRGVSVTSFTTGPHGPQSAGMIDRSDWNIKILREKYFLSRQLMVVDSGKRLLTARVFPHMVLIEVSVSPPSSSLTLSYPGLPAVTVELPGQPASQSQPGYAVFREAVSGCDLGDQVGAWLSEAECSTAGQR